MYLNSAQRDRALGAIFASAAGDALGANYEFQPPVPSNLPVSMHDGTWAAGEWTDDTAMGIAILQALAAGDKLEDEQTQDNIVHSWHLWSQTARDVGLHTRELLSGLRRRTAAEALQVSQFIHEQTGKTAGNGSLMRTGPIALGSLESAELTVANATRISKLTHWDDDAATACVLWSLAIRHAILNGVLDVRIGLEHLDVNTRRRWSDLIDEAERHPAAYFSKNGWVVHAFQGAWSAIHQAMSVPASEVNYEAERVPLGLEFAVRAGFDTDTVAAIAGSLLGARFGVTAVPATWMMRLHGQMLDGGVRELRMLANLALSGGDSDEDGWPIEDHMTYTKFPDRFEFAKFPLDDGLYLGGVGQLRSLPQDITAVVSLCRLGQKDIPEHVQLQHEVLLIDSADPEKNANLDYTLANAALAVKEMRDLGHKVFLHCVQAQSRTPSVAMVYAVQELGYDLSTASMAVQRALPHSAPNSRFAKVLNDLLNN